MTPRPPTQSCIRLVGPTKMIPTPSVHPQLLTSLRPLLCFFLKVSVVVWFSCLPLLVRIYSMSRLVKSTVDQNVDPEIFLLLLFFFFLMLPIEQLLNLRQVVNFPQKRCQPLVCMFYRISVSGNIHNIMCGLRNERVGAVNSKLCFQSSASVIIIIIFPLDLIALTFLKRKQKTNKQQCAEL